MHNRNTKTQKTHHEKRCRNVVHKKDETSTKKTRALTSGQKTELRQQISEKVVNWICLNNRPKSVIEDTELIELCETMIEFGHRLAPVLKVEGQQTKSDI